MTTPTAVLTRLRARLGREANVSTQKGRRQAGDAGEFLTENLLDQLDLAWIKSVQHKNVYSMTMGKALAARPDYLVRADDANFFLDSKNLTPSATNGTNFTFELKKENHARLARAAKLFGLPVLLVVWVRNAQNIQCAFADPEDFNRVIEREGESFVTADLSKAEFRRFEPT